MSDRDALLAAICAHPDEDTPRLVYADWLDEHADAFPAPVAVRARAQFIRDDIAMSLRDEYDPIRLRWELIEKPQRETEGWVKDTLPPGLGLLEMTSEPLLRRGFFWGVRLNPDPFMRNASRIREVAPIEALSFGGSGATVDVLFRSLHLAPLTGLRASDTANISPRSVQLLADSPHATGVTELDVGYYGLQPSAVPVLVQSPIFARLERLNLHGGAPHAARLVETIPHAGASGRLGELDLAGTGLTGAQVERLLTAGATHRLTRLSLASCWIGGVEAVVRSPLEMLRDLDLSATGPGRDGFRALSAAPVLSRLHRLGYRNNHVTGPLMAELASRPEVSNLRVLDLASNAIGNAGATAVAHSPHFARLLVLNLSYCMVGDEGAEAILESPLADGLVLLTLTGSPASAEMKERLKERMGDRVRV